MSDVKIEQRELSDGQRAYYAWLNTHFLSDNQIERIKAEFEYLQTENTKLRELVRDMLHWMPCQRPCQRCERYRYPEGCEFEIRRRKLGVEVV